MPRVNLQYLSTAKSLMIYSISHFIVFSRKRLHWFQSRAPGKGSCFRRCLRGRGAAIARAKAGGAGRARGAASAAKPGSTAATACITGAEAAALRGIVFMVEVAAAGAAPKLLELRPQPDAPE